jgi:ribonuclease VapC
VIVVDTSALIAILREEPEREAFAQRLSRDDGPRISAGTLLEASIVLRTTDKKTAHIADAELDRFIAAGAIIVVDVTVDHANEARKAHAKYGKGTGHPAQLNFGDCFAYALAKSLNVPLLYKGKDFAPTDIVSAL